MERYVVPFPSRAGGRRQRYDVRGVCGAVCEGVKRTRVACVQPCCSLVRPEGPSPLPPLSCHTANDEGEEEGNSKLPGTPLTSQSFPSPSSSIRSAFMRDHEQQQHEHLEEDESSSSIASSLVLPLPVTATASGLRKKEEDESFGDAFRRIAEQKAAGEKELQAKLASKEHARRKHPNMQRVYTDYHLKVMVAGEAGQGKTTYVQGEKKGRKRVRGRRSA